MVALTARLGRVLGRVVQQGRQRGPIIAARDCIEWAWQWWRGHPRRGRRPRSFMWEGDQVPYFTHRYHYTWLNERAVEVALALRVLADHPGARVLEIGNVLGHYMPVSHTVVDKYESGPGIHNMDVVDLDLGPRFDLILAISTLEHVGLDEDEKDPQKAARAVMRLRQHLAPRGRLWITHPVGYNLALDEQIRAGALSFTNLTALRRDRRRNRWAQVPVDQVWSAAYDWLLYTAHGVVVAEFVAPETSPDTQVFGT